jgi:hypothetical protein
MDYSHLRHYGDSLSPKSRLFEITCGGPSSWSEEIGAVKPTKDSDNDNVSLRSMTPLPKNRSFLPKKWESLPSGMYK